MECKTCEKCGATNSLINKVRERARYGFHTLCDDCIAEQEYDYLRERCWNEYEEHEDL